MLGTSRTIRWTEAGDRPLPVGKIPAPARSSGALCPENEHETRPSTIHHTNRQAD